MKRHKSFSLFPLTSSLSCSSFILLLSLICRHSALTRVGYVLAEYSSHHISTIKLLFFLWNMSHRDNAVAIEL